MRAVGAIGNRAFRRRRASRPQKQEQQQQSRRSIEGDDDDDDSFTSVPPAGPASSIDEAEFHEARESPKKRRRIKAPYLFPKPLRRFCGRIVEDERFQVFIVVLITINSIMMGIATYDVIDENPRASHAFEICDLVFLIIFTVELGMQFVYRDFRILSDGWLVFDLVVIVLSWALAEVQIVRAFRIFRAFRLLGRVDVLRNLIDALLSIVPNLAAVGCLLLLIFYIFAVIFTELFMFTYAEGVTSEDYFSRLGDSFFSLFQIMTMDGWAEISREVMAEYTWAWAPFVVFVIISGFVVVNLIIAVICDAIALLHDEVPDMLDEKHRYEGGVRVAAGGGAPASSSPSAAAAPTFDGDDDDFRADDDPMMVAEEARDPAPAPERRNLEWEVDDLSARLEGLMRDQALAQRALEDLIVQLQLSDAVELAPKK